ncbi:MAG: hypothetical protein KJ597_02375 [Nanoarchaeota archaeon]|nr:hypothetical protein [Nanoarchaeota archaeon]MBU1622396.1 hypothetical protein [Nanoarchaeota archaeon]
MIKQSKHNAKVRKVAGGYKSKGYKVNADVPGYKPPKNTWRHRPDVTASKGKDKVIVEVETRKSFGKDTRQRQVLRKYARKTGARFRTVKA